MSETETTLGVPTFADDPLLADGLLGVALGVVERLLVNFQLTTVAGRVQTVGTPDDEYILCIGHTDYIRKLLDE